MPRRKLKVVEYRAPLQSEIPLQSTTSDVEEVTISYKAASGAIWEAVLVDTPGLDHTSLTNHEVVQKIAEWFNNRKRQANRLLGVSGILYCHDISSDFVNPTMRLDLDVLSQLCGPKAFSLVTFVTLKWDKLNRPMLGDVREAEMERRFWAQAICGQPCAVRRVRDQRDAIPLLAMIFELTKKLTDSPLLQIQSDLEKFNGDWTTTEAAKCLDPYKKRKMSARSLRSWWKALHVPRNSPIMPSADSDSMGELIDPLFGETAKGDLVFLIMGEVHAGKSTLLKTLTGAEDIEIGTKLTPCTQQVLGRFGIEGKRGMGERLIFVDTPGLDGSTKTLRLIASWLRQSCEKEIDVGGIIFLHDISRAELPSSSRQNLKTFAKICGDRCMKRVGLVTTKWDRVPFQEGKDRAQELEAVWKTLCGGDLIFHLYAGEPDQEEPHLVFCGSPTDIIHEILSNAGGIYPSLQIQEEMLREGRSLWETSAGREVPDLLQQEKHLRRHRLW